MKAKKPKEATNRSSDSRNVLDTRKPQYRHLASKLWHRHAIVTLTSRTKPVYWDD